MHNTTHNQHQGPQSEPAVGVGDEFLTASWHSTDSETQPVDSQPIPEGGYGWVCVVCTFLMNAHTWGINSVRHITEIDVESQADPTARRMEYSYHTISLPMHFPEQQHSNMHLSAV